MRFGISREVAKSILGEDWIQKSKKGEQKSDHKYIWRTPKETGKGYDYIYEEDQVKNPFDMLLKFFKIGKSTVTKLYKDHNIEADYKATENQFASHVLEYEAKKDKWDKIFSSIDKNKATQNPKTMAQAKDIEKKNAEKKGKEAVKNLEEKKFVPNKTLMRKIWAIRNPEKAKEMDILIAQMNASKNKNVAETIDRQQAGNDKIRADFVGRRATIDKKTGITTFTFTDGTVIQRDKKNNIVFDSRYDNAVTEETPVESNETFDETAYNDSHNWDAERIAKEKKLAESYGYDAFKSGMARATANDELFNNYLNDIQDNKDTISVEDAIKGVKSIKHQLMAEWLSGWDRANIESAQEEKESESEEHKNRSNAMLGNDNAKKDGIDDETASKLNDIKQFGIEVGLELSPDTVTSIMNNMSEYTFGGLKGALKEYAEKVTPFTLAHIDESIEAWNDRIAKEKLDFVNMYNRVRRDYLLTIKNSKKDESAVEESTEKTGYTDGEKAAIALAYRKEKDFDPTLSDYAYYEKIKAKMPDLDAKGELYSTMLNVKDMMLSDSQLNAAKEYLEGKSETSVNANSHAEEYKQAHNLTQDQYEALDEYTQSPYINNDLRNDSKLSDTEDKMIVEMDSAIASNTVKENKLYRGVSIRSIFPDMNIAEFRYLRGKIMNPSFEVPDEDWVDLKKYSNLNENVTKFLSELNGKVVSDKAYMSTSKDYETAANFATETYRQDDGVVLDLNIPDGTKGIDLEGFQGTKETKREGEVLLGRNTNYRITGARVENGRLVISADVLSESDFEAHKNRSEAMMDNDNAKGKHNVKPKTNAENKAEKKKENESRRKAGLKVPKEELGERSSSIEDVDIQNHEFADTEESTKEELESEVKTPSNQAQKDAFNELAAARLELKKKEFGISFYGKSNHKFASTEEEVAEAQKKYDEALAKYNKLLGGDNTDFSYNPNAENYAYRDTGYIAGSQKEKIAQFWADVAERGGGVKLEDIDWVALEENLRYAESKIIKSNILKKPDFEALRDSGMSGGAAYFYNRLIDCIPTKPAENTPEGHRNYVLAINTFQERMEKCKSLDEMVKEMETIADELSGSYVNIDRAPEVVKIQHEIDQYANEVKREQKEFNEAESKLWEIPEIKQFAKENNNEIRSRYGKPYPFNVLGSRDEDGKLAANFFGYWINNDRFYDFIKNNEKVLSKYDSFKNYKKLLDKSEIVDTQRYALNRQVLTATEKKVKELQDQKRAVIRKINDEFKLTSPEYKMWAAFGDKYKGRFAEYMRSADGFNSWVYRGNKTILGHYQNARRGKFDDWEWLPKKEENSVSGEKKERKESFQLLVATEHERKGGKNVSVKTTQELKEMFNLRDIQSGEWVLKDPKSAKWHVDRCCEGFSDLCDVTGIPENLVSLNGRLALAIGARGHKGALAHYEPVERVINITKMHGGGSLAHEWFHSFDNMLSEAMLGGDIDAWLTKPGKTGMKNAPDNIIPEVKQAFENLVKAMKQGDNLVMKSVNVTDTDRKNPDKVLRSVLYYRNYGHDTMTIYSDVMKATSFEDANSILMSKAKSFITGYNGTVSEGRVKLFQQAQRAIAAKFGKDKVDVFTGETASNFFIESRKLDGGKEGGYWASLHEMAARAFSGFVGDNLRNNGRVNTYLTSHDTNDSYIMYGVKPNPEGEERERINAAFRELFNAVKSTNAIRKAIAVLDGDVFIPQVITNGKRFLIRKSIMKSLLK